MSIASLICAPKPALHTQGELRPHESIEVPGREDWPLGTEVHEDGMVTDAKFPQLLKASVPMVITDDGIVTDVRELQQAKAESPMEVTDDGIVTDARELQPMKARSPMVVTDDGIVTDVRDLQP